MTTRLPLRETATQPPLRTLFITNKIPYPPVGGGALRNWQNITNLMQYGPVGVFCLKVEYGPTEDSFPAPPGVSLYRVHTVRRQPYRNGGDRVRYLLHCLWQRVDLFTESHYSPAAAEALDRVLREFRPDLVVFEELWVNRYLPIVKRHDCQSVYDAHNAETFRFRQILFEVGRLRRFSDWIEAPIRARLIEMVERRVVQQVDQTWVCSQEDKHLLQGLSQSSGAIAVVPNGVNLTGYENVRLGQQSLPAGWQPNPHTVVFTASYSYSPNIVAANLLLEEIFPRLQARYPDCQLLLVGADPTDAMLSAAEQNPGVIVTGKVPEIQPYLAAASVVIVPLLQGGGTRLKILEAFAAGRPVVSTAKGAEGIAARDGVHLLIRDDVDGLVEAVCELWRNPALGQTLSQSAYELVQESYAWEAIGHTLAEAIAPLRQGNYPEGGTASHRAMAETPMSSAMKP